MTTRIRYTIYKANIQDGVVTGTFGCNVDGFQLTEHFAAHRERPRGYILTHLPSGCSVRWGVYFKSLKAAGHMANFLEAAATKRFWQTVGPYNKQKTLPKHVQPIIDYLVKYSPSNPRVFSFAETEEMMMCRIIIT